MRCDAISHCCSFSDADSTFCTRVSIDNDVLFVQMFNQINARKIEDEYNVFEGILQSRIFMVIWFGVVGVQVT